MSLGTGQSNQNCTHLYTADMSRAYETGPYSTRNASTSPTCLALIFTLPFQSRTKNKNRTPDISDAQQKVCVVSVLSRWLKILLRLMFFFFFFTLFLSLCVTCFQETYEQKSQLGKPPKYQRPPQSLSHTHTNTHPLRWRPCLGVALSPMEGRGLPKNPSPQSSLHHEKP